MQDQSTVILEHLKSTGAFLEGHFVLTSGRHSPHYIEKFRVFEHPRMTALLCESMAAAHADAGITVVVGPVTGGIILAHEVARQLGVRAMFTERVDGVMTFRRGFHLETEDRVLIVEDIVTTGGSVKEVIEVVRATGAMLHGVAYLVDRSGGKAEFGVPSRALLTMDVVTYSPESCPLCASGVPIRKPGRSGKS